LSFILTVHVAGKTTTTSFVFNCINIDSIFIPTSYIMI